jgi:hypothetical protein
MLRSKTLRERIEGRIARKRGEDVFLTRGSFSNLKSKTNDEPQTILKVEFPSLLNQPIRCTVSVLHRNPGESFCDTGFKSVLP